MKWIANVDVLAAEAGENRSYSLFPIEAEIEIEAARNAAISVAKELYGEHGESGFVAPQTEPGLYIASCGLYQGNGLTRGHSLSIKIDLYEGKQ